MDTRSDTDFGYSMSKGIQSFRIGVVESVKKLKSVESMCESTETSLKGRPGISIRSTEVLATTRVKLGRNVSSSGYDGGEKLKE